MLHYSTLCHKQLEKEQKEMRPLPSLIQSQSRLCPKLLETQPKGMRSQPDLTQNLCRLLYTVNETSQQQKNRQDPCPTLKKEFTTNNLKESL